MTGALEGALGEVRAEEAGDRLDVVLAARLGEPRARTQQRIEAGEVTVDHVRAVKSRRLVAGEQIAVAAPPPPPVRPAPPAVPVRYEDEDLLVVAKPAGLVVHPGAGTADSTLVDALRARGTPLADTGDADRPGIVHRLDRGTSGLLAVAKRARARDGLVAALAGRTVTRRYWALVDGVPAEASATIDAPIGRSRTQRTRFTVDPAGRPAITHYDVAEDFGAAAVLSVRLDTGRTHQIRVHLSAVGHPVCGDRAYGADRSLAAALALERPALHAASLRFDHPVTGVPVAVDEPLPEDLAAAVERLRARRTT